MPVFIQMVQMLQSASMLEEEYLNGKCVNSSLCFVILWEDDAAQQQHKRLLSNLNVYDFEEKNRV